MLLTAPTPGDTLELAWTRLSKPTVKFKINRKVISASAYEFLKALIKKELADSNLSNRTKIDFELHDFN